MDSESFSSSSSPSTTTTGSFSSSSSLSIRNIQSRRNLSRYKPFQDPHTVQENHHLPRQYGDRFIPNRSAMDFNMAHYLLVHSKKNKENEKNSVVSTSKAAYRKHLAEALGMNRTQILQFKSKPLAPVDGIFQEALSDSIPTHQLKSKPRRFIPKTEESWIEVPGIIDDYHLNLLDWSSSNIVAIAVANTVYLSNASDDSFTELLTVDEKTGPITSISWHPDGKHIAVGMASSIVELWDATADRKLGTLRGGHDALVGSLSWNNHILTTGGMDSFIFDNDLRIRCPIVQTYIGHQKEVCGLKWSSTGQQLASGGADNLLYIWDRSMASSNAPSSQWLHRFEDHTAIVKAIAWCPFQSNLLASGGGAGDHCIKFWNTRTGACLNSVDTGSEVTSLLWSKNERELLSSQGFTQSQLTLWKYPSMVTMAELTGHTSTVLFTAQSPDGCTVASAAGDGSLRFWNVFGSPEVAKPAPKATNLGPFANLMHIR